MDIDNGIFIDLVHKLESKRKEVEVLEDTLFHAILDENNLECGDKVILRNKTNERVVIGTLLTATVIKENNHIYKAIVVRPDNVYEKFTFSFAEWDCRVYKN